MGWTTIGVAVVTALAAIGAQWVAARAAADREAEAAQRARWDARRRVCADLLAEADQLTARANGVLVTQRRIELEPDVVSGYLRAKVAAELAVGPSAWREMEPLLTAVQLRLQLAAANAPTDMRIEAGRALTEIQGDYPDGWDALRARFVAAVRSELGDDD